MLSFELINRNSDHCSDIIMSAMTSQITSVSIVCSTVCSRVDQRKYQISASLSFVRGIQRSPVDSPHKGPVTRKIFPLGDVIMDYEICTSPICLLRLVNQQSRQSVPIRFFSRKKWQESVKWRVNSGSSGRLMIFEVAFSSLFQWMISWVFSVKLPSGKHHKTSLMTNQH